MWMIHVKVSSIRFKNIRQDKTWQTANNSSKFSFKQSSITTKKCNFIKPVGFSFWDFVPRLLTMSSAPGLGGVTHIRKPRCQLAPLRV